MLPIEPPFPPMEARSVDAVPLGEGWLYEPKWDGFRALAFRDGQRVSLQSKSGQPLGRYFPELIAALEDVEAGRFVLDGELMVSSPGGAPSFEELLQRIHPASSRVARLARETPALVVVFDLLVDGDGRSLVEEPLSRRRPLLEGFFAAYLEGRPAFRLSPASMDAADVQRWFAHVGDGLDGVVAKRQDSPYLSGQRGAMVKMKQLRTADCVVGGFRRGARGDVGSLLLGLYDEEGRLDHVGFTSSLPRSERRGLRERLEALAAAPGFTGRAPGGPSRWSRGRDSDEWVPLSPRLVVEVSYDHVSGGRFRHGVRFLRWRPDKAPSQCRMDQILAAAHGSPLELTASHQPTASP